MAPIILDLARALNPRTWLRNLLSPKRPFKLTNAGWIFILYTIGVGAGAINTGNNLLYLVFGVFLGLIVASGVLSDASLWGLDAEWTLPETAECGKPSYIPVTFRNGKKRWPSLAVSLEISGRLKDEESVLRIFVPAVAAGGELMSQVTFVPDRRGRFEVRRATFFTRYPFGLLRKMWTFFRTEGDGPVPSFIVYPSIRPLSLAGLFHQSAGAEPLADSSERGDEGSALFGVRDFRPGDNPKRIHWRASAKIGSTLLAGRDPWLIKEMEKEKSEEIRLFWPRLDVFQTMPEGTVESFLSYTASLLWLCRENGLEANLLIPAGNGVLAISEWGGADVKKALEFLALFDPRRPESPEIQLYLKAWKGASGAGRSLDVLAAHQAQLRQEAA